MVSAEVKKLPIFGRTVIVSLSCLACYDLCTALLIICWLTESSKADTYPDYQLLNGNHDTVFAALEFNCVSYSINDRLSLS